MTVRAGFERLDWILTGQTRLTLRQQAKADYDAAKARKDTRDLHLAAERLRAATEAELWGART